MSLRAFYLFIELLTVKKCLVYVIKRHLMHIKKQILGRSKDFKESFKLFETI